MMARCSRHPPAARDRGTAVVEHVLAVPVVLTLTLLGVQAALALHAANVAASAAAQGAAAGSARGASVEAASDVAMATVAELGGRLGTAPHVARDGDEVVVRVDVQVPSVVPFFPTTVSRIAREPLERFVPEPDR